MARGNFAIAVVCAIFCLALGCSEKTLSIFFDGVGKTKKGPGASAKPAENSTQVQVFKHAPFAEGACDACHNPQKGHKLLYAKEELCLTCHSFDQSKKYVHGPVASGDCLLCHDPHTSRYPALLVAEPRAFCTNCHDLDSLTRSHPDMTADMQCTVCHEPHISDNQFLLK